jgi:glyoxalase family protein
MDAVRLWERDLEATAVFLTDVMGFAKVGQEGDWHRFTLGAKAAGTMVDLREDRTLTRGAWGTGGIHHVAWRVTDEEAELVVRERVEVAGRRPTPPIDRFWFTSVYFLEPGGVLFELATDGPGFDRDEAAHRLGETLILPPWLEPQRAEIERALPPLRTA